MPRITADMIARALVESEKKLPPERRTTLQGVSETEVRVRGVIDFVEWADALNEIAFPGPRAVETDP